jgi:hypothetical protein
MYVKVLLLSTAGTTVERDGKYGGNSVVVNCY